MDAATIGYFFWRNFFRAARIFKGMSHGIHTAVIRAPLHRDPIVGVAYRVSDLSGVSN
jgi:hypothetical protein